jgi:hypothetical protein
MSLSILDSPTSGLPLVDACPHGLRPGTTVCLYCLREKRLAARRRRYRVAARVGLLAAGGGVLLTLVIGGIVALAPSARGSDGPPAPAGLMLAGAPTKLPGSISRTTGSRTELEPSIAAGRTALGEGMYAERAGDSVIVHFDTETLRTRFDWKFEGVVRATLPLVFPEATEALAAIPQATLVRGGILLRELPVRGIRLPLAGNADAALTIWPVTRPGVDGPLVVAYRVKATR